MNIRLSFLVLILGRLLTSCGGDFIDLPYPYEIDKKCILDIPEETIVYIKSQAEFDRLILSTDDETKTGNEYSFL